MVRKVRVSAHESRMFVNYIGCLGAFRRNVVKIFLLKTYLARAQGGVSLCVALVSCVG